MTTVADIDPTRRPGEYIHQALLRSIFASIAVCLDESGEPLTPEQVAILGAAVASAGTDTTQLRSIA